MSTMVNPRWIFIAILTAGTLSADVKYTLRCDIESPDKQMAKSGALATAMKDCTSTVLQSANRQAFRNGKSTQIFELGSETVITIDHEKKTWSKNGLAETESRTQAAMAQLKQMGANFKMISNPLSEPKTIAGFASKGMVSILEMSFNFPGMQQGMSTRTQLEFWVSDSAPGAKEFIEWTEKNKAVSPTLRMMGLFLASFPGGDQVLKDTKNFVGQLMEMSVHMETKGLADTLNLRMTMRAEGFDTSPIPPSEFAIPDGYQEVK